MPSIQKAFRKTLYSKDIGTKNTRHYKARMLLLSIKQKTEEHVSLRICSWFKHAVKVHGGEFQEGIQSSFMWGDFSEKLEKYRITFHFLLGAVRCYMSQPFHEFYLKNEESQPKWEKQLHNV